ncbi:two pore calcium channel protein 2-like [Chanos chanos]|uniref:Two pore channel protein 2 n=1 Tax=Chanos chanos TaxID=29144 RepID=A0A6J2WKK2_CHACN|nr:two pore calcium channel protein 2-like [Chanos chanos]
MEDYPLLPKSILKNSRDYGLNGRAADLRARRSSTWVTGEEDLYIQQAVILIEDAIHYRSINHRMDLRSLRVYRWYFSRIYQRGLNVVITVILALAFIEKPSSMSVTSDLRYKLSPWEAPCGLTESIELICLLIFTLDLTIKVYLIDWEEFWKCKWLMCYLVVIVGSIVDWTLSLSVVCNEVRHHLSIRKIIRPFFLLQNSSLMKKTLKCIKRTLPEITSVILLILLHLCLFTMFGMVIFARGEETEDSGEWESYFKDLPQSLSSLLVLLTTANNPDVMTPAYSSNRSYSLFFILFSSIGTYFLMHLLTAAIYNQFRGYLLLSIQTSVLRRCMGIRAAFELLSGQNLSQSLAGDNTVERAQVKTVVKVLKKVEMKAYYKQAIIKRALQSYSGFIEREAFQKLFDELDKDRIKEHPPVPEYTSRLPQKIQCFFRYYYGTQVGNAVALVNIICIFIILVMDSHKIVSQRDEFYLETINCFFIVYYLLEMILKIIALGWRGYLSYGNNIFDGLLTVFLVGLQISIFATYRLPYPNWNPAQKGLLSLWEMARLVNMLIVFRFLRIIPNIKLMALAASTLVDLVKNLRAFAGILVVVYYVFAILGVWLFRGAIPAPGNISANVNSSTNRMTVNLSENCGTYEQLGYWANNFDDFASALVLLYNIMVVNNWQVFLEAYSRYTSEWSKIYFIFWWLTSSVLWVNLFVALILENFIYKWDRSHDSSITEVETTLQLMFREHIQKPSEEEVVTRLHEHPHLHLTL